jgi:2-keto-4-pentenoate hydratase
MEQPDQVADALLAAYASRIPIPPLTETYGALSIDDAYAIQLRQVQAWLASGRRVLGRKVGLTSAAMQRQLGVTQPDFGHLLDDMFYLPDTPVQAGRFLQPRVEPEVAFVLRRDLAGPGVTAADVIAATEFVRPALEIIDSRIAGWRIGIVDTIADNASSGGVVLGDPARLADVDLIGGGCQLFRNGELAGRGVGGAVLGSPTNSVAWLANVLGERDSGLRAGQVVLPGSITASIPFHPGDVVSAVFAGLGTLTCASEADS